MAAYPFQYVPKTERAPRTEQKKLEKVFGPKKKRCGAEHPMFFVCCCEEPAGHEGEHFNSFYSRRWS